MNNSEKCIFRPRYEQYYLGLLAIFLILALASMFGLVSLPGHGERWVRIVTAFVGFNYLHTILTFVGLAAVPEIRAWFLTQFKPKRIAVFVFITTGILFLAIVQREHLFSDTTAGMFFSSALVLLLYVHNLSQTKGLSLLYNRQLRAQLTDTERVRQSKIERSERWIFNILLVTYVIFHFARTIFKDGNYVNLLIFLRLFFFGITVLLMLNALRYPKVFKTNKFFFLQGVWLFVLMPITPAVVYFQMCLHGIEYLLLADVAYSKSASYQNKSKFWILSCFLVMAFYAVIKGFDSRTFVASKGLLSESVLTVLIVTLIFFEFLHYYLDSIMFRFHDPEVRKNIAPLFSPKEG